MEDLNDLKDLLNKHQNAEEMTDSEVAELKAAQEKMMGSAQKLFSKMYESQSAGAGAGSGSGSYGGGYGGGFGGGNAGGGNNGGEAGYGDDVVDADYKEV